MTTTETRPRAVIVGIGACTPLGRSAKELGDAILEGRNKICAEHRFGTEAFDDIPMSVFESNPDFGLPLRHTDWMDRGALFVLAALDEALKQACYSREHFDRRRVAVVVGTSHSGIESIERLFVGAIKHPEKAFDPRVLLASSVDHPAGVLCAKLGALGPKYTFSSACASSNTAIGVGADLIATDQADLVIVAGTDTVSLSIVAGFGSLRAVSRQATAPFSEPVGLTLGEGAGVLLIERLEHAQRRGVAPIAEVLGYGLSGDAHHETAPDPDGLGVASAISRALDASGVSAETIDLISAHGTGTEANDGAEVHGTYRVVPSSVPITSTKSTIGHTLGASGLLELIVALHCAEKGYLPPTANFTTARASCPPAMDYVHGPLRRADVDVILKNNFGFGGNNSSLIVRRSVAKSDDRLVPISARSVGISGIGAVSAAGKSWTDLVEAIWEAKDLTVHDEAFKGRVGLIGPIQLPPALKAYGRSSPLIKYGIVASQEALGRSGIQVQENNSVGLVCGVMYGAERSVEKYFTSVFQQGPQFASAMHFPMTTLNAMGGGVSIACNLKGYNTTLSSSLSALTYAHSLVASARQDEVLVASADEMTPLSHSVFFDLFGRSSDANDMPTILGEGGLAFTLVVAGSQDGQGTKPLAIVAGLALVQDGRMAKVDHRGLGVQRAIERALVSAGMSAADVGCVVETVPPMRAYAGASATGLHSMFADRISVVNADRVCGYAPSMSFGLAVATGCEILTSRSLPKSGGEISARSFDSTHKVVLVLGISLVGDIACVVLRAS